MSQSTEHGVRIICKVARPAYMRELEPRCPENPRGYVYLSPRQLTDLLNYILALPLRGHRGVIMRDRISPVVIQSWHEDQRGKVQTWCETQLIYAGLLPKRHGGRTPPGHPQLLDAWLRKPWERTA